jgi:hypothetical protein
MSNFLGHSGLKAADCGTLMLKTPAEAGYRMPAERMPHECCWMAWPSRAEQWPDGIAGAQRTYAAIAHAIRRFEPVRMVVEPEGIDEARTQCDSSIELIPFPIDNPWALPRILDREVLCRLLDEVEPFPHARCRALPLGRVCSALHDATRPLPVNAAPPSQPAHTKVRHRTATSR